MVGIVVSSFVIVSIILYQGGSITGWQSLEVPTDGGFDLDFGDQNVIDEGDTAATGTGEERQGEDTDTSSRRESSNEARESRIDPQKKSEFLNRFGVSELDAAEVYLAPIIVNAETYEVPQRCRDAVDEYYVCSSPVTSSCLYADANKIMTGRAEGYTEILCIRNERADVTCPSVFRERVACAVKSVQVATSETPQFAPDGTPIEEVVVATQLLDENSDLVALLSLIKRDGKVVRADVEFTNARDSGAAV